MLQRQDLAPIHSSSPCFRSDAKGNNNLVSQVDRLTRPGRAQAAQGQDVHRLHKLASLRLRQVYAHLLRGRFDAACINLLFLSHNPSRAYSRRILVRYPQPTKRERRKKRKDKLLVTHDAQEARRFDTSMLATLSHNPAQAQAVYMYAAIDAQQMRSPGGERQDLIDKSKSARRAVTHRTPPHTTKYRQVRWIITIWVQRRYEQVPTDGSRLRAAWTQGLHGMEATQHSSS